MSGKGRWLLAGALIAGVSLAGVRPTAAQVAQPPPSPPSGAEIDPSAPLDPMPDLGVDWPDLDAPDAGPLPILPDTAPDLAVPQADQLDDLAAERRYALTVTGLAGDTAALLERFRDSSVLEADRNRSANAATLDRRARADAELLSELLRAAGYYDAEVQPSVQPEGGQIRITLAVHPGPLYRFTSVELPGLDQAGAEDATELRRAFAVKQGDPVDAAKVSAAGRALQVALGQRGFALAQIGEQDIVIDHASRSARLVLPVDPGAYQRFGRIRVNAGAPFDAAHVATIARFDPDERFRQSRVDDLRRALIATGLVSVAEVRVVPAADSRTVDLDVRLGRAPPRTIAGELGYGTGEGFRAEANWQHRNFFPPEGALTVRGVIGTQEQLAGVTVRFNNWRARDRVLTVSVNASHVDRDAFEARTLQLVGTVERQSNFLWQKPWTWSVGGELLASDERDVDTLTDLERRRTFFIAAVPATLAYDGSDDLLDPTRGFRLGGRISPELSLQGGAFGYARLQLDASAYRPLSDRIVAAGRVRLGTILGASRDRIAPSRRFYAGGGGSVRGYGYQRLGPLDAAGDPIGGRSLAEFSLEGRVRFGNFGVVPFVDAGTLSTSSLPKLNDWQVGVGLGLRYYSSFGPIRLDGGTPLNRRQGDGRVAVTVSLGQAF